MAQILQSAQKHNLYPIITAVDGPHLMRVQHYRRLYWVSALLFNEQKVHTLQRDIMWVTTAYRSKHYTINWEEDRIQTSRHWLDQAGRLEFAIRETAWLLIILFKVALKKIFIKAAKACFWDNHIQVCRLAALLCLQHFNWKVSIAELEGYIEVTQRDALKVKFWSEKILFA